MILSAAAFFSSAIAALLLLVGAVLAADLLTRAAETSRSNWARRRTIIFSAIGLGVMAWSAAHLVIDDSAMAQSLNATALSAAISAALIGVFLVFCLIRCRSAWRRNAAFTALLILFAAGVAALVGGLFHHLGAGASALAQFLLAATAATLGMQLAFERRRVPHLALVGCALAACALIGPPTAPDAEATRSMMLDASAIETSSIAALSDGPASFTFIVASAALGLGVLSTLFSGNILGAAPAFAKARTSLDRQGARVVSYAPPSAMKPTMTALISAADEELSIVNALERAIERRDLDIDIQPQRRLSDGALLGGEALLRWRRGPDAGLTPDRFIPLAEKHGLIDKLGGYVLAAACSAAAQWPNDLCIAVNVSPLQLQGDGFEAVLDAILTETNLDPRRLEIEITESRLPDDSSFDLALLERIHRRGVQISLDDFGRGESSLARLEALRVDQIKLDRSLVAEVDHSETARAIVRSCVDMAEKLGVAVLAEGVETLAQLGFHRSAGCVSVQGYAIGKPMALEDFPHSAPPWPLSQS